MKDRVSETVTTLLICGFCLVMGIPIYKLSRAEDPSSTVYHLGDILPFVWAAIGILGVIHIVAIWVEGSSRSK
jgi:hypothetical protein